MQKDMKRISTLYVVALKHYQTNSKIIMAATITTNNFANTFLSQAAGFSRKTSTPGVQSSPVPLHGRPAMATRRGRRVRCALEETKPSSSTYLVGGGGASLMAAVAALETTAAGPAVALVDERMSTEGTGLPFGLSNILLGWILLGVFGLIWSLYFIYTTGLDEDDDSGLSL
ncbi:hypothetical protein Ddye_025640 [Dipteronia dyeriana]|uniref:PSII 6.1 kDa protein n=1 Tax=Dipteronia dyeriana TaxID=168575 RepID=A0AAD9WPS8_9ROSI|nr:hypothetical protein Ddye_025640 [Dipteronia dyeriana]